MPDDSTKPDFRRLPERHVLGETIFKAIGGHPGSMASDCQRA